MWLFTKKGFFSIVQDKDDKDYFIVRSRVKGDLENYFADARVREDEGSDYRFRVKSSAAGVHSLLMQAADEINYTNYKAAVHVEDQRRSEFYGMVWAILADMQELFLEQDKK